MNLSTYKNDIDKFLIEVALAGASYGLSDQIGVMYRYLSHNRARTAAPAAIAVGLSFIISKQYPKALLFLDDVLNGEEYANFHEEARNLKALVFKLQGNDELLKQELAQISPQFGQALNSIVIR